MINNFLIIICILVVNRGQPTPNHVITRPLLLTHTNSSPAHLVLSAASSKVYDRCHPVLEIITI